MAALLRAARRRALLLAGLCYTAGCLLVQTRCDAPHPWAALALAALLALGGAALAPRAPGACFLLTLLGFLVAGAFAAGLRARVVAPLGTEGEALVEGVVREPPTRRAGRVQFRLRVAGQQAPQGFGPARQELQVWAPEEVSLGAGDRVRARVRLSPLRPPLNPGEPDRRVRQWAEGLSAHASVVEKQVVVLGDPSWLERRARPLRARFGALLEALVVDPESRALVAALAAGDRARLSEETNDAFNRSGLVHVLSVSGLHVAVVAAGLFRALRWLLTRAEPIALRVDARAAAALAAMPPTWYYVVFTGAEIPAVRSAVMACAVLAALALGRDRDGWTALGAALLAALAHDPAALQSVSFQLSFSAVAGLMLLSGPLRAAIPVARPAPFARGLARRLQRAREAFLTTAAASLAASLATAPLVANAFHRASLVAVVANVVALPLASALTALCALAALLFAAHEALGLLPLLLVEPLARLLLETTELFAHLPLASAPLASPSGWVILAWYALLLAVAGRTARRALRLGLAGAALAVLGWALLWRLAGPHFTRTLSVTFYAVGWGDAALVRFPGGASLLIDGGGDPSGRSDVSQRVIRPALAEEGASAPDVLLLSHAHPDHALGLLSAMRELRRGELWVAARAPPSRLREQVLSLAASRGLRIRRLSAGQSIPGFEPARVEVLHPPADGPWLGANDASLVLRIALGDVAFLFTGDIEREGESELLRQGDLRAAVLKAPHHGSATSSSPELVAAVGARHVVASVGRAKGPVPALDAVLERYARRGARVWRTDQWGAVRFVTDGRTLRVEPFLKEAQAAPLPARRADGSGECACGTGLPLGVPRATSHGAEVP